MKNTVAAAIAAVAVLCSTPQNASAATGVSTYPIHSTCQYSSLQNGSVIVTDLALKDPSDTATPQAQLRILGAGCSNIALTDLTMHFPANKYTVIGLTSFGAINGVNPTSADPTTGEVKYTNLNYNVTSNFAVTYALRTPELRGYEKVSVDAKINGTWYSLLNTSNSSTTKNYHRIGTQTQPEPTQTTTPTTPTTTTPTSTTTDFKPLMDYMHRLSTKIMAGGLAVGISYIIIKQFRWRT